MNINGQLMKVINKLHVGSIDIATSEVSGRQMTDRWFTLTVASPAVRKDGRPVPSSPAVVRIKVNFRSIKILPVGLYKPLIEVCRRFIMHCNMVFGCIPILWIALVSHFLTLHSVHV